MMRLINNLKSIDHGDYKLPYKDVSDTGSGSEKKVLGPKALLHGTRVPVNCQENFQALPNEVFFRGRDLDQEYQKLTQGHPNLADFSTHPSDHSNFKIKADPVEAGDSSLAFGLHLILGQLSAPYDSPITAFACTERVNFMKRYGSQVPDQGFMATGHADGAIVLYKVSRSGAEKLNDLHSDDSGRNPPACQIKDDPNFRLTFNSEAAAPFSVECISLVLGNPGRIKILKFVENETSSWVVFSVTDTGEVSKWDIRDGNCRASFQPHDYLQAQLIDEIYPVGNGAEFLLCAGPGTLLLLTFSDLKLVSNLSNEMLYTSALPIQAGRSTSQVPILVRGPNCGEIALGKLSLGAGESLDLLCMLSLGTEVTYWESNPYPSSSEMQQVLLVSPSAFVLVQVEQTQMMRQLTQSIPPPSADDIWTGGFFMADSQLVVFAKGGSVYHYAWEAAGGLTRVGEMTPFEAPQLAASQFNSLFVCAEEHHLVGLLPGSSQLIGAGIRLPVTPSINTLSGRWQQRLPKPGEKSEVTMTALTPLYLETESEAEPRPWVAKGFKDGTIHVVKLAQMFDRIEEDSSRILTSQGHAITCLHQPSGVGKKQLLVSGDASGGIRLWEMSSWARLAAFQGHGQPVCTIFQLSDQQLVFSLAQDASISIFCLKRMICLGLIPGHRAPVSQVLYYPEPVLEIVYEDGYCSYWLLQPSGVRICLEKVTSTRICGVRLCGMRSPSLRADFACYPAWDMHHPFPVLQVFDVNVRSLLRSMSSAVEPGIRLLAQVKNLPTSDGATRRASTIPEAPHPSSDTGLKLSYFLLHALLTKDDLCDGVEHSAKPLLIGIKGAGSKITFMLHESAGVWKISPHATANRLLPSIVLAKAVHAHEGNQSKAIAGLTNLPELVGEGFQFPCLGYLAKFWQDSSSNVQSAARSLLLSLFGQLGFTRQRQLVDEWLLQMPQTVPIDLIHGAGLAVIVLGIVLANFPNLIHDIARGRIARSLEWFISNHTRPNFRLPAIQIVSSSFQNFEAYVNGVWILRSLYSGHHDQNRQIQLASQQAALQMALINPPLFITSLGLAKGIPQLSSIMQLISSLVQTSQPLLLPHIARVVEVIVKSLDPRDSLQRQSLIGPATQCLHDLVAAYPMVDFHPGSQRLAVGVMEGAAVVYDLYTSTRCLVVEGYHSPVSAVAFSPDGKFLATFSVQESLLKIWNSSGGLFDMLAKTLRGHSPAPVPASKSRSPLSVNSMFLSPHPKSQPAPVSAPTSGRTSPGNLAPPREYSGSVSGSSSPLSIFSSSPMPYRTFNTSLGDGPSGNPDSHLIELRFSADRCLLLVANGISLVFNI